MSFLAPLFLAGAAAVALPILFHLMRQTTREKQPFSSLLFLQTTPPRMTRRSRPEHLLLLLLRCLVICLLAIGFARPFLKQLLPVVAQTTPDRRLVLLVDTSASMRRQGLWAEAGTRAEAILRQARPRDEVAVLAFDREVRTVVSFEQWAAGDPARRAELAVEKIKALSPGWASTSFGNALIQAVESLDKNSPDSGRPTEIILITDLQEGGRLDGLQDYQWPRGISVKLEQVRPRQPGNAGLQWVAEANDYGGAGTTNAIRLRVVNSTDARREQFQIRWEDAAGSAPVEVYVPPGQSRIVSAPALAPGVIGRRLVLSGDDEPFDNLAAVVPPQPMPVKVLFVGNEAEDDPAQSLYYLKRAFQQTRSYVVTVVPCSGGAPLEATALSGAQLIIFGAGAGIQPARTARPFLAEGGMGLLVLSSPEATGTLQELVGSRGATVTEGALPASGYAMLGEIDFEHPLLAPFADPRFSDFTKIHFWHYRSFAVEGLPGTRVLWRFDSGPPALVEVPVGRGRLMVLASGWQPHDSQLARSSKFVPLLYSLLEQGGGLTGPVTRFRVGDPVVLGKAGGSGPVSVRGPDGSVYQVDPGEPRFTRTDLPGSYRATIRTNSLEFAVGLDIAESRTAPLPAEELEHVGVPLGTDKAPVSSRESVSRRLQANRVELENRQKLWRWLLAGAFGVLLVESWLAAFITRRAVP